MEDALGRVDVQKDQELFIEHNIRPFTAPGDWVFEPCSMHYDTVRFFFFFGAVVLFLRCVLE